MADPFVAEIRIFPFNFPPNGWAFCDGQILPISQNTALFALLGTTYGGDGKSTFALPNLQGRVPVHHGQGPGLSLRDLGEAGGSEAVALLESEMPQHLHTAQASAAPAEATSPQGSLFAVAEERTYAPRGTLWSMHPLAAGEAGGSQPHNNLQPYLAFNFCIALQGVFPPRS